MNPSVSVIVPVYGVEPYLDRCVKSIVSQTLENIEIILVDDGSMDRCPEMCDKWAQTDPRIRVIHKQNGGLGNARNSGMDLAAGDTVCFIDGDDFLLPEALEKSYQAITRQNADTVCYGFQKVNANGRVHEKVIPTPAAWSYSGKQVQEDFLPNFISPDPGTGYDFHLYMSAWAELISRKTIEINHWRFASERDIISEDLYSLLALYRNVQKVIILPEVFYCYCENVDSLTHVYRKDRYGKLAEFYRKAVSLCGECGYRSDVAIRLKRPFLSFTLAAMKMIQRSSMEPNVKKEELRMICHDEVMREVLRAYFNRADSQILRLFWRMVKDRRIGAVSLMLATQNYIDRRRSVRAQSGKKGTALSSLIGTE